jgi:ABC-type branched-subunit amino acid transport system substrate-binding protein
MMTWYTLTLPTLRHGLKAAALVAALTLSPQKAEANRTPAKPKQDVSATEVIPLTPEQLATEADRSLSLRNLAKAESLFQHLAEHDGDHSLYGLASVYTLRGQYTKALETLGDMHLRRQSVYHADAATLRGRLLLTLADIAQRQGKLDEADNRLKEFHQAHRDSRADRERFDALMRTQARLQNLADNRPPLQLEPPLRVGVLLPLSGPHKQVGEDLLHSILLAVFENPLNNLTVMPLDTGGTPTGAQVALNHALSYGVDVILGPLTAAEVAEIKPYARTAGKPVIAYSSDATVAGDGVFLMSFIPAEQARRMARHGIEQGKTTFGALLPDNAYGNEMLQAFAAEVAKLGGTVVRHAFYNPAEVDLSAALRRLVQMDKSANQIQREREALERQYRELGRAMDEASLSRLRQLRRAKPTAMVDFEALFVPASGEAMPLIAPQLAFYDVDSTRVMLLGGTLWDSPRLLRNRGEYLRGGRFPAVDRRGVDRFEAAFKQAFSRMPHSLSVLGYDSARLLAELMAEGRIQPATLPRRLQREQGFRGATGAYRFTDGGITQRQFDLVQVRTRDFQPLEKAPYVWPPIVPERQKSAPVWRSLFDPFF